ncbi:glycosyltransferase family 2 protein [Aurantibacillus circumpalustris]|uniref:glycosyltransferase family 2 protein n=1 Tax=Aurantibacillus circumpalustris TaxID=3036359 RepID=UPI00295AA2A7|nr:glycosyltransferase [Aurantibacillus circumpalustris]
MPGISVLIVTNNRAHLIGETIRSVLGQTLSNFELIIIDDGSTDNTEEIVRSFVDTRIHYFYSPRIGHLTTLRNLAVSKSKMEFIAFIDSDDLWHPEKLERCLLACIEGSAELCLTDCQEFSSPFQLKASRGKHLEDKKFIDIKTEVLIHNVPLTYGTNIFMRRDLFVKIGGFNESFFHGDHDFICRALYNSKSIYIGRVLSYMRKHESNMSQISSKSDLRPYFEYNETLKYLHQRGHVSKKDFTKISAENHFKMARLNLENFELKKARSHLFLSLKFNFKLRIILGFLKTLFSRSFLFSSNIPK